MRWICAPILWLLELADRAMCRLRGHRWSYGDHGYCRRPFCFAARIKEET